MADSSAVQHLARAHQTHGATVALLPAMRRAAAALAVPMADREYYRPEILSAALVQEQGRTSTQRVVGHVPLSRDLLIRLTSQEHDLWVNGHLHQLAEATLGKGRVLKNCFLDICSLLTDCGRVSTVTGRYPLSRLRNSLSAFEAMWVQFEEAYIKEAFELTLAQETSQSQKVHKTLAEMVLSGFLELRHYLHKASQRMLWIDPQLSNNSELERCLFPLALQEEHSTWPQLQQQFQDLCSSSLARTGCERSWGSWVSHMLHGPGIKSAEDGEGWNDALDASREEAFLRDVEGVSMHLQRHQPERWNRCCHLLLRCSARAFDSWVPPQPGMLSI
eukprot:g10398.t1